MSGLFAQKKGMTNDNCHDKPSTSSRHVSLNEDLLDHVQLAESTRIYTMFPQMPNPLPLPSTSPEELRKEIDSRPICMLENSRDPHQDKFGRKFTHISTSKVSNTIHGVYFTMEVTDKMGSQYQLVWKIWNLKYTHFFLYGCHFSEIYDHSPFSALNLKPI